MKTKKNTFEYVLVIVGTVILTSVLERYGLKEWSIDGFIVLCSMSMIVAGFARIYGGRP